MKKLLALAFAMTLTLGISSGTPSAIGQQTPGEALEEVCEDLWGTADMACWHAAVTFLHIGSADDLEAWVDLYTICLVARSTAQELCPREEGEEGEEGGEGN